MSRLAIAAALAFEANAALGFVEFWKVVGCDIGGMYNFKDLACGVSADWKTMIPGG
jgi:hypothetical protein